MIIPPYAPVLNSGSFILSAGTHSVTITDGVGTTWTGTITLTEPAPLMAMSVPVLA